MSKVLGDAPSRAKHSVRPWTIREYGDGDSLVIESAPGWRVCFMATPGDSASSMATIRANADLIAAAPDMLEALKWIALFANVRSEDDRKTFARVQRQALRTISERAAAAVAEAEGRS